jgi:hypothetical protein
MKRRKMMNVSANSALQEVVRMLDEADRKGRSHAAFPSDKRHRIIEELERCLVDTDELKHYMRELQTAVRGQPRYSDDGILADEAQFESVTKHGLSVLDDVSLIQLALNPFVLWALHDHIIEAAFSRHWRDLFSLV